MTLVYQNMTLVYQNVTLVWSNTGTKKWFKIQHSNTNIQIIVQTVIPGHKNPGGFKAQHRNI